MSAVDPYMQRMASGQLNGLDANRARKKLLQNSLAQMANGNLGMSQSQQRAYTDAANAQTNAMANAQQQAIGQSAFAAGQAPSGQYAALQRQLAQESQNATAANSAETMRANEALKQTEADKINTELDRQQQLQQQKAQFWTNQIFGLAKTAIGVAGPAINAALGGA